MDYIPWQQFYQMRKNKQPINEIVAEYNKMLLGYEELLTHKVSGGSDTFIGFLLTENSEILLTENSEPIEL